MATLGDKARVWAAEYEAQYSAEVARCAAQIKSSMVAAARSGASRIDLHHPEPCIFMAWLDAVKAVRDPCKETGLRTEFDFTTWHDAETGMGKELRAISKAAVLSHPHRVVFVDVLAREVQRACKNGDSSFIVAFDTTASGTVGSTRNLKWSVLGFPPDTTPADMFFLATVCEAEKLECRLKLDSKQGGGYGYNYIQVSWTK